MKKIFSHRKAFSLVELFIAMVVIAIFTSFVTSNITTQSQTVKQETEKLAAFITDLMRKADRRHMDFTIKFSNLKNVNVVWGSNKSNDIYISKENPSKTVILTPGFYISEKTFNGSEVTYDSNSNEFSNNGTFTIKHVNTDDEYYLVIYKGRVRASETKDAL